MIKNNYVFQVILFSVLLFLISCSAYNEAIIAIRSEPTGAKIYDSNDSYLGRTPLELKYEIPQSLYDQGASSWSLGSFKAYLSGYETKSQKILLDLSNHSIPGDQRRPLAFPSLEYYYNFLIVFESPKTRRNTMNDEFYISSFQETKAGEYPPKRDSFNKTEVPEFIVLGYKGKSVNIIIYSISTSQKVFDHSLYIPEQNENTYRSIPLRGLTPDSYKVHCLVEGVDVKTLYFVISN